MKLILTLFIMMLVGVAARGSSSDILPKKNIILPKKILQQKGLRGSSSCDYILSHLHQLDSRSFGVEAFWRDLGYSPPLEW